MMTPTHARTVRQRGACALTLPVLVVGWLGLPTAFAEGHGPVFALATPTLGSGGWSSDTVAMHASTSRGSPSALGQMFGYGVHEDLQVNFKFPLYSDAGDSPVPNMRNGMMGAAGDVEASLMWRFHRRAPGVGTRRESTLHLGVAAPTADRRGLRPGPSANAAVATGYASRGTYWWLAAGGQFFRGRGDDRLGNLYYATAAFGYRPLRFRSDAALLDLRWFVEAVAEFPQRDRLEGQRASDTGGRRLLAGPSFLALSGPWGLSGGMLFPVYEDLRDAEPDGRYRAKLVVTYWF